MPGWLKALLIVAAVVVLLIVAVIGILIGTYSSIAIAAPILVAYQDWRSGRGKPPAMVPVVKEANRREKVKAKA